MATWIERWPAGVGDGPRVAVKDLFDVAGSVTTAGCKTLADRAEPAASDAPCVARMRQAGARFVGKANLHELAFGVTGVNQWYGTPTNPADPGRIPGGSSSGSAAAVAAGEADIALGTDTGGSVRIPAGCCAVAGLKTTFGLVPVEGVWPLAPSFDTVGILASSVAGIVKGMAMLGADLAAGGGLGELPGVVGRAVLPPSVEIDPAIDLAVDAALTSAGLRLEAAPLPGWAEAYRQQQRALIHEAYECDRHLLELDEGRGVGDAIRHRLLTGSGVDEAGYREAMAYRATWSEALGSVIGRFGAVALPTLPARAPFPDAVPPGFNELTAPVNLAGFPALAIPIPVPGRPPASLQLVGAPGSEALLCGLGALIEAATETA